MGTAFLGAPVVIHARPRANLGVRVTVLRGGREVARVRGVLGRRFNVPTPGTGRFLARVEVAGRTVTVPLRAGARTLAVGSTGLDVLALRARLARLHVQVPAPSTTFGAELFDSIVAFQKARGLERTGAVDAATWRALAQDVVPTPRYRGTGNHIEVSKSRQILMVVRDGETVWYLPVSSGAGGITPVGNYRILWKALATTVARPGDPVPDDDLPYALRDPRLRVRADLPGEPRLCADPDLARRLALPPVGEPVYVYE
jgi:peptidoglycan hydrolase-like protein with peptidoglycan-binding domain